MKEQITNFTAMNLYEKRNCVDKLAVNIGYHSNKKLTEKQERFVWDLIDFGYKEDPVMQSRCSLRAKLDFNSENFEQQLDKDFHELLGML